MRFALPATPLLPIALGKCSPNLFPTKVSAGNVIPPLLQSLSSPAAADGVSPYFSNGIYCLYSFGYRVAIAVPCHCRLIYRSLAAASSWLSSSSLVPSFVRRGPPRSKQELVWLREGLSSPALRLSPIRNWTRSAPSHGSLSQTTKRPSMSIIIRVVIVVTCAYAGSVAAGAQFAELPSCYRAMQN
jgi:hypothetical protein